MLLPCPSSPGFAATTAEAEKSPVTQLPDAEASELIEPPKKGLTNTHGIGPMLAEVDPLPPSLVKPKPHSVPVVGGPAVAVAEKVPARANGAPARRQVTHNADKPSNAFIAIPPGQVLSNGVVYPSRPVRQQKAELIALEWDL
jgi:hypothetical protein